MGSGPGWGNPVVGGTTLRIPAIQSPNFSLTNHTGWAIFADGSAYFFNITAIGTITGGSLIIDGASGGVFVYSGTPALGNLIGSWAGAAGTDAQGNAYPQGLNVTIGKISGSTITGSVFDGTDFIINSSGAFFYTSTPALGNLFVSIASVAGTDGFGNVYKQGIYLYGSTSSFVGLFNSTQAGLDLVPPGVTSLTSDATIFAKSLNAGLVNEQTLLAISSGKESSRNDAALQLFSDSADGTLVATATFEFGGLIYYTLNTSVATLFAVPLLIKNQSNPQVQLLPSGNTVVTTNPSYQATSVNGGLANEQTLGVMSSGKVSSLDDAAIQMFSESADATIPARAVLEFGGTVQMQVDKTRVILSSQGSTPAQNSGNAVLYATGTGGLNTVDGLDGQTYNAQRRTLKLNSDTPVAGSPGTAVFSSTVGVRSYVVRGMMVLSITNAAQQVSLNIAPPTGTGHPVATVMRAAVLISMTDFNLNSLTPIGGAATLSAGSKYVLQFESIMNVTSSGTFQVIVAGTNANDITVLAHSYISLEVV